MRVIAGKFRSRPLRSLPGMDIRPTADRLRETLFNILTPGNPQALAGSVWIDLFAGTGAVGMEALSRGARQVYFVESDRKHAALIRANLAALGVTPANAGFDILECDAAAGLKRLAVAQVKADYVFLDPPWRLHEEYAKVLTALGGSGSILADGALVLAEHEKKFDPGSGNSGEFGALRRTRQLVQGDAVLSFYRAEYHPE